MVRVTPQDAQAMKDAYAKMYAPKEEPQPEPETTSEFQLGRAVDLSSESSEEESE
tara:strand:+ start:3356 stop:3520 length:165 start_codon:yes stop_codon:yes gene_type:complete